VLPTFTVSPINNSQPLLLPPRIRLDSSPRGLLLALETLTHSLVRKSDDSSFGSDVLGRVELRRVLLPDNAVSREVGEEEGGDEGLAGVVRDYGHPTHPTSVLLPLSASEEGHTGDG
jgi:hypothetical protein